MESTETEPLECDPHPAIIVDAQAREKEHCDTTTASPETEAFESDAYAMPAVGFVDLQAVGNEGDGDRSTSKKAEYLEQDPEVSAAIASGAQAGGSEYNNSAGGSGELEALEFDPYAVASVSVVALQGRVGKHDDTIVVSAERVALESNPDANDVQAGGREDNSSVVGSGEPQALKCDPYAMASVSTMASQGGGNKHVDTIVVSTEKVALESNPDVVDVQAGGSEHDDTVMAAAETQAVGCKFYATAELDCKVPLDECTTDVSSETERMQGDASVLIPGNDEVSGTPIKHLEQELIAMTQGANMVSNHEGSFGAASPAGETGGDGTFEHIAIHNESEIQVEEHLFDISEFDLGANDVPMTGTFFSEHCMFPALDADKVEVWQGSEDVILMESSCEHTSDQPRNMNAPPVRSSSDTMGNHDVAEELVTELPLQTSSDIAQVDVVHELNESSGMNDSLVQSQENVDGCQCNEADNEHAEGLQPVIVKGAELPSEDIEDPDVQEIHVQGDAEGTFVSSTEKNMDVVQRQTMTSEDICSTNNLAEEIDDEGNHLNATHNDAAGLGVESSNANTAPNEESLHLKTQDTLVGSTVDTFKSHEESITLALGNVGIECIDSQSDEKRACEQPVEAEKGTLSNERDFNNHSETAFMAGNTGLVCALANSKQEENIPAIVLSSESSMDTVIPAAESLAQEEMITLNEKSTHEKVMLNNEGLQVGPVVSRMEVDKLHIEEVEKQIDDPLMSVKVSDGNIIDIKQTDAEESTEDRGEVVEDKVVGREQEKKETNEQEELLLKLPIDAGPSQAGIAEETTQDVTAKRTNIASLSDIKSFEGSDVNALDSRQSDGEESVEDRGEVVEDKIAGTVQEIEEKNQQEHSLQPPVHTRPLQAGIAEEGTITAERINIASYSDAETAASSCSNLAPVNDLPEGVSIDHIDKKPAAQSLKPVDEDNEGEMNVRLPVGADSLSKKQLEKHTNYRKLPVLKGGNKLDSNILQAKEDDDVDSDDGWASEPEEEPSDRIVHKTHKAGNAFGIGDLVWAKVRSHPWWPAQIFDPADASKSARKAKKFGKVLVAFFGDCTFAWLQQSQMIAFQPNFREKVKQTTLRIFCIAVEEALEELCRRAELGLSCAHFKGSLHSTSSFPDTNTGIREGVRVKRHKDFGSSVQMFRPNKTLEFVKGVACSPLGKWCSTLKFAELRGHVYGLRTCMVASGSFDSAPLLSTIGTVPPHGSKLKRPYSLLGTNDDADGGGSRKGAKKTKDEVATDEQGLRQVSKKPRKAAAGGRGNDVESKSLARKSVEASERNKDGCIIKFKMSKKIRRDGLSSAEGLLDTAPGQGVESEKSSDDSRETLLALAGSPRKVLKRSSSKESKNIGSLKKKAHSQTMVGLQIPINSEGPDSEAAASPRTEGNAEDACAVMSSLSEEKVSKPKVKRRKDKRKQVMVARSPASSIDAEDMHEGTHQTKFSKTSKVEFKEVEMEKEEIGNDKQEGKKEPVRKFNRVGDSIRKVAGELTGTPVTKNFNDFSAKTSSRPTIKLKLQASPTPKKAASKESSEDVSLLQLRQDLELLAHEAGGGLRKPVKHVKKGDRAETGAGKTSPQWQNVPHKTQKSCVQELALAARKRKSEMVHDEVVAKLPKTSSTTGSQGHRAPISYIKGAEKPTEHRSLDKSFSYYSRRSASLASNLKVSSPRYDEKLSSHMPLGLFMRFPEDFPLPSESQLKAAFIPFGPLQMSATRLYHDSASAQVVFKHGRDAESAMKHAKKNALFGPVAVTYRLRHLSHTSKVESKDASPPDSINSSMPVKRQYSAKERVASISAAADSRAGGKEVGTSVVPTVGNHPMGSGSEPTGDIQDQMMTLLRQVSVLVKPSPVGSDGK